LGGVKADASWRRARRIELRAGDRVNDVGQNYWRAFLAIGLRRAEVMLELPGGHNQVGFADEPLSRALSQFWSNPD
jgi:hypothetical protein